MEWKSEMTRNAITCRHDELKHGVMLAKGGVGWGGMWVKQPQLVPDSDLPPTPRRHNGTHTRTA
jgi:hypothetical protein